MELLFCLRTLDSQQRNNVLVVYKSQEFKLAKRSLCKKRVLEGFVDALDRHLRELFHLGLAVVRGDHDSVGAMTN